MASAPSVLRIPWLNENAGRKYPIHEDSSLRDTSDSVTLPNDFLVDMILPVHSDPSIDTLKFHVHTISVFGTGVTLTLGYDGTAFGSVTIPSTGFVRNSTFFLQGTGNFFDTQAKVVIGSLETVQSLAGSFQFSVEATRLVPTVIVNDIRGVSALVLRNGDDVSDPLQNDVVLQAGRNMLITFVAGDGSLANPSRIIFNAISGQGLNQDCSCDEAVDLPCIKTVNGLEPDGSGVFHLLESDCLKLEELSNGLQLNDDCATPCCGCQELDVVRETLERVVTQVNSLENLAARLESAVGTMEFNLLRSSILGRD